MSEKLYSSFAETANRTEQNWNQHKQTTRQSEKKPNAKPQKNKSEKAKKRVEEYALCLPARR